MGSFIENGGRVRLITSVILSTEDQDALKTILLEKEKTILCEIESIEDELKKDHIRMFSWMIQKNLVELKIAVVEKGLAHSKVGILRDTDGNIVTFSGSENETVHGWLFNDEEFHVFCSWKPGEKEHIDPDIEQFEKYWKDQGKRIKIYDISDAFKQGLIKTAPKDDQEFKRLSAKATEELLKNNLVCYQKTKKGTEIEVRDYQSKAINAWRDNNYKGILAMATGTGKTYTSLFAVREYLKTKNVPQLLIICCPYQHLVDQWEKNIERIFEGTTIVKCYDNKTQWYGPLNALMQNLISGRDNFGIVVTTTATGSSDLFLRTVNTDKINKIVIGDEVHNLGAKHYQNFMKIDSHARLGLSATPIRKYDEEGNKSIQDYFGSPVYTLNIKQAIEMNFLVPYNYFVRFCTLTDDEYQEYKIISAKIASLYARGENIDDDKLQYLLMKRARLTSSCSNKLAEFREVLRGIGDYSNMLVYTAENPEFFKESLKVLEEENIITLKITADINKNERTEIIKKLERKDIQCILAMRCLDEGVDIPSADKAIILASSENSKQYIQRRGRVLRKDKEGKKKLAVIHDIFVLPPQFEDKIDKALYERELRRVLEFASAAQNYNTVSEIMEFSRRNALMRNFSETLKEFEI